MLIRSNFFERRKHHRFKVKTRAFVQFHKPRLFKLGKSRAAKSAQIVDLSGGGLSFQYTAHDMWTLDSNELSISNNFDKIRIDKIPFTAVSDFSISRVKNSLLLRRCGIKFRELTPKQKYQLHALIQSHTINNHPMDRRVSKNRRQSGSPLNDGSNRRKGTERRERLLTK